MSPSTRSGLYAHSGELSNYFFTSYNFFALYDHSADVFSGRACGAPENQHGTSPLYFPWAGVLPHPSPHLRRTWAHLCLHVGNLTSMFRTNAFQCRLHLIDASRQSFTQKILTVMSETLVCSAWQGTMCPGTASTSVSRLIYMSIFRKKFALGYFFDSEALTAELPNCRIAICRNAVCRNADCRLPNCRIAE